MVAEQVEPLGQSVALTDPEPPNEPSTYEQHLFFASDPEWQCEAAGLGAYGRDLMAIPEHCQDRVLMSFDRSLDQIYGFSSFDTRRIETYAWGTAAVKGSYEATITTEQEAMQWVLSITQKPATSGGSTGADSGYSHQSGPTQWDVRVNAGYDTIEGVFARLDASNPGDPNPPEGDCEKLAILVDNVAAVSTDAASFVQNLVSQVIGNLDTLSGQDFEKANRIPGAPYGDSGFKQQFRDGGNQVRHFVGGLWAGFLYGPGVAQLGMNSNEDNTVTDGRGIRRSAAGILPTLFPADASNADVALNSISVVLGTQLFPRAEERVDVGDKGWRKIPARPGFKGLAAEIRRSVCD